MFYVFVLLALAGQPADILKSNASWETKEACEAVRPELIERLAPAVAQIPDLTIAKSVCATDETALND